MTSDNSTQTVTIYKAPQPGLAQKLLRDGFQPADFPNNPPYENGKCYFAAPDSRSLAEEYNNHYQQGILEVIIDKQTGASRFCKCPNKCKIVKINKSVKKSREKEP